MDKEKADPELQEFLEVEQQKAQLQGQVRLHSIHLITLMLDVLTVAF